MNEQIMNQPNLEMYRTINSKFMADGILFPENFASAKRKILWILKEPYGDLPEFYGDGIQERVDGKKTDSPHTWQRIALTSYLILKGKKEISQVPPWAEYGQSLKQIAIVNVKKHAGKSTINMVEFSKFYRANRTILSEIIKGQIKEAKPDVIIGGGTLNLIKDDLGERNELERGHFTIDDTLYLNTWHPAQRKLGLLKYSNQLVSRVGELLEPR